MTSAQNLASPWERLWRKSGLISRDDYDSERDPGSPDASRLLSAFVEEVKKRYDSPPADVGIFDPGLVLVPRSVFLVARRDTKAVGCGALVPMDEYFVEVKRMFVAREERGLGIATMILDALERLGPGI